LPARTATWLRQSTTCSVPGPSGRPGRGSARRWSPRRWWIGSWPPTTGSCSRCPSASNGSCPACSIRPWPSAGRNRRARRSCAGTGGGGRRTRTGSSALSSQPRRPRRPAQRYAGLAANFGASAYARQDAPATREQKAKLGALEASQVNAKTIGGEAVKSVLTSAPGNNAPIGGLKVTTDNAWFAVRPSGTEDVYKIYAESLRDEDHLRTVQHDARTLVDGVLG